jgi:hypothetical protein
MNLIEYLHNQGNSYIGLRNLLVWRVADPHSAVYFSPDGPEFIFENESHVRPILSP